MKRRRRLLASCIAAILTRRQSSRLTGYEKSSGAEGEKLTSCSIEPPPIEGSPIFSRRAYKTPRTVLTGAARRNTRSRPARLRAPWTILPGISLAGPQPTRRGEVALRETPQNILRSTASAPARASNTVRTGKTIDDAAETFTAESGMVNLPWYHSLIHFHLFFREVFLV